MQTLTCSRISAPLLYCPLCATGTRQDVVYEKWGYPIVRCVGCGLGATLVNDAFRPETLYDAAYFQGGRPDGYADYAGSEAILRAEFRRTLRHMRRHGIRSGRLLEVGCAHGFFLLEAQSWFQGTGLDVSPEAVEAGRGRGLDVFAGQVDRDFMRDHGPFDVAVLLDAIEHLPDPAATLHHLARGLTDNGHVVLSTGDWGSILSRGLGRRWRLLTPPQHLYFFSRSTLCALLDRCGFEVVALDRPWKIVPLGLACYQLSRRLGLPLPVPRALASVGVPVNLFDAIRVIARKRKS